VIHGIEDYGNKMGIPTVNGAILYHKGYTANPLVFCGCLGLLPRDSHPNKAQAGDLIVVIGGRTGRDGLRGATFSSMELVNTTSEIAGSSVQIGNPIQEKQVQEVILQARDERLYHAITDCGAGGLSSAVGEMGQPLGARVYLERVPLKYPGLRPWEIWLSEAQERMVLSVPPEHWERLQQICLGQDVGAVNIGSFERSGRLRLFYSERVVADITMAFLHDGIPQRHLQAAWSPSKTSHPPNREQIPSRGDLKDTVLKLLAHPNIHSKEHVICRYDHEVQAGTVIKPLVGAANHGPSDAAVIIPLDTTQSGNPQRGVAIANGICPLYGEIDPYAMAWAAIDEAIRNLVAVGADPDQIAILDNFCWGNGNLPDRLGSLVRCAQGCFDAALAYGVPFISGKDSLNNEYADVDGQRHAIPGTLLISAIGIVPEVSNTVTMDLKGAGNLLYVVGETRDEMGGSHYNLVHGIDGGSVPQPVPSAIETMRALHKAIRAGLVQSCHDVSEGGIAVALAEMCIGGRLGAEIYANNISNNQTPVERMLFSESSSRFLVEVRHEDKQAFEAILGKVPHKDCAWIQKASVGLLLRYDNGQVEQSINCSLEELESTWRGQVPQPTVQPKPPLKQRRDSVLIPTVRGRISKLRVLILHANGSNRDRDAYAACELAGGEPEIVHVNQLKSGERKLLDHHMLVVPGGFSYGDDLGAGTLWALDLRSRLGDDVRKFIEEGRPVLGICNGFQALVKAGLLPGGNWDGGTRRVTLTNNQSGHFECRWVYLKPNKQSQCLFTEGLDDLIYCPVAHGEGRIAVSDEYTVNKLWNDGLPALTYVDANGEALGYPVNPNGSIYNIAGLCNPTGNVFGLMPHPEDHVFAWQHPRCHRGETGMTGLKLFQNGIKFA
jgi:phosphoribosylformylglycinamidine synthase